MNALVACIVLLSGTTVGGDAVSVPHTAVQYAKLTPEGRVVIYVGENAAQTLDDGEEFLEQYKDAVDKCNIK